jgi:tetratricopeptide (TPR) repeat protein/predicted Ser/Thr protein kinase
MLRGGLEGDGSEHTLRLPKDGVDESAALPSEPDESPRGAPARVSAGAGDRDGLSAEQPWAAAPGLEVGTCVGRYEVLQVVGSGGMGTLYRAHDPRLARDIALKVLHDSSSGSPLQAEGRARLLREAQVLARLSHPNVVAAYDIGSRDGAVFIAMELIEGVTLSDWLAKPRARADVLRVLIAAGRGLAAAHAAGVLHRDVKPANVMVSSDGRVRVIDFGLARTAGSENEPPRSDAAQPGEPPRASSTLHEMSSATLTRPGRVGTWGYISPEQLRGKPVDHRSDQFSYAVTAFVALTGQLPYPSGIGGAHRRDPSGARTAWPRSIPRPLRRILDRGLSLDPERRYPSLAAMVVELERVVWPRWQRTTSLAVAAVLAAGVGLPGGSPRAPALAATCNIDDMALRGVWDTAQRDGIERAFRATGQRNAIEAFELVARRLDTFAQQWMSMRRDSCEATLARGEQSERVMALRATCLDRALAGTRALITALAQVNAGAVNRVAQAAPASLAACSDVPALLGVANQLPAEPIARATIDDVAVGVAVNQALIEAGRSAESLEQAREVLERARTTQHLPTIAAATAQLGRAMHQTASTIEQRSAGEQLLNESIRLAAEAGDERLVAHTSSYLFNSIAYHQKRTQEAKAMVPVVEAIVQRAGNDRRDRMALLLGQSTLLFQDSNFDGAIQALQEVIRLSEGAADELAQYSIPAATDLGHIYVEFNRFDEAEAIERRAVDDVRRLYGGQHPRMMSAYGNLSTVQAKAGHRDLALASIAEYRRLAATMPADEPRLKYLPLQESRVWRITGDCARAVPLLRDALLQFSAADGADGALTTMVMNDLGACLAATNHIPEALSFLTRALANRRRSGDVLMFNSAFELAKVLWSSPAQRSRARSLAKEALSHWQSDGSGRLVMEVEKWLAERP